MTKASSRGLKSDASGKCCYRLPERRCKQNDRIWTVQLDARHRHFGPVRFRIGTRNLLQIHSSGWKQCLDGIKSRGFGYTVEQWVPVVLQVRVYNLWNIVIRFQSRKRILFIQIDSSNISSERLRAWRSVYYSSASIHLHHNIDVWLKHLEENSDHAPLQLVFVTSIGHRTSVWDALCMWWFFSCRFEFDCRCIQLLEHRYRRRFSRE